jgi:hypothetical protein
MKRRKRRRIGHCGRKMDDDEPVSEDYEEFDDEDENESENDSYEEYFNSNYRNF